LPRNGESRKVTYFDNKNPVENVIGKTMIKAAIYGLIAINPRVTTSLSRIKL
jgi:hypothetical protein